MIISSYQSKFKPHHFKKSFIEIINATLNKIETIKKNTHTHQYTHRGKSKKVAVR